MESRDHAGDAPTVVARRREPWAEQAALPQARGKIVQGEGQLRQRGAPSEREEREARAVLCSRHFLRSWSRLPGQKRKPLQAKIRVLACSPAHPSLQAYRLLYPSGAIWGCWLSRGMRLLYHFDARCIYLLDVGRHEIVERLPQRAYLEEQQ